jgi:16S rRNA G527 N7-methylase RsmG
MKKGKDAAASRHAIEGGGEKPLELLAEGLRLLSLVPTEAESKALRTYFDEILFWNLKYGLVNATERELVIKHLLDSLAPFAELRCLLGLAPRGCVPEAACLSVIDAGAAARAVASTGSSYIDAGATAGAAAGTCTTPGASAGSLRAAGAVAGAVEESALQPVSLAAGRPSMADAGSGAGLPGIPLAIFLQDTLTAPGVQIASGARVMPGAQVTLIERSGRRVRFLENALVMLGLKNVDIQEKDIAEAEGLFNVVTFRAFRPLESDIWRAVAALRSPGGAIAAYKGRREAVDAELAALDAEVPGILDGERIDIIPVHVPFLEEERNLLILRRRN